MTVSTFLRLDCPACHSESRHPLQIENERIIAPLRILAPLVKHRVRITTGERDRQHILVICPDCGLVSFFDPEIVQRGTAPSLTSEASS